MRDTEIIAGSSIAAVNKSSVAKIGFSDESRKPYRQSSRFPFAIWTSRMVRHILKNSSRIINICLCTYYYNNDLPPEVFLRWPHFRPLNFSSFPCLSQTQPYFLCPLLCQGLHVSMGAAPRWRISRGIRINVLISRTYVFFFSRVGSVDKNFSTRIEWFEIASDWFQIVYLEGRLNGQKMAPRHFRNFAFYQIY